MDKEGLINGFITGKVYFDGDRQGIPVRDVKFMKFRRIGKVGRNDHCPCGSGQKFKRCCMIRKFTPN